MNNKGLAALIECLKFLDDLRVQLLDHAHSDDEVAKSTGRWGILVPAKVVEIPANVPKSTIQRWMKAQKKLARSTRKNQSDQIDSARMVLQELIREFGKSDFVPLGKIEPE